LQLQVIPMLFIILFYHFLLFEIFISTILQIRQEWELVQKSFISTFFLVCLFEIRISTIEIEKKIKKIKKTKFN
jgi:hypothetical protein